MLEQCLRCGRAFSTNTRDATPESSDRCPVCRLPEPAPDKVVPPVAGFSVPRAVPIARISRWKWFLAGLVVGAIAMFLVLWLLWPGLMLWRLTSSNDDGTSLDVPDRLAAYRLAEAVVADVLAERHG